jgi:hypothetical protein
MGHFTWYLVTCNELSLPYMANDVPIRLVTYSFDNTMANYLTGMLSPFITDIDLSSKSLSIGLPTKGDARCSSLAEVR